MSEALMGVADVAAFLNVSELRVERLARERLLISKANDANGKPLFEQGDVQRYKTLAERLGGL